MNAQALSQRGSDEQLHLLVEAVEDYALSMLDPAGNIFTWNAGAERIQSYNVDEIIGKHFSIFYPSEGRRSS